MNSIDMFPLGTEGRTRQTGHLDCVCYLEHQGFGCPMQATPCRPAVGWYGRFCLILSSTSKREKLEQGEMLTEQNSSSSLSLIPGLRV